ncbi:Hypothetical predicted protein [Octopus vulgaris]|uniref:Uncharacterized protein n=1 Tax=Octopus vulgaris TaxID=6645 RepID=A0AA36ATG2_OCTVU|nr:Hypothetical predicted protein [Octopus vulgaris]
MFSGYRNMKLLVFCDSDDSMTHPVCILMAVIVRIKPHQLLSTATWVYNTLDITFDDVTKSDVPEFNNVVSRQCHPK